MWRYRQSTGQLFDTSGACIARGYSGAVDAKNDPTKQDVPKHGPLPRGVYTIGVPHDSTHTGKYTMNLTPDAANEMFGRDDFRIHGDSIQHPGTASEGCIIMPRTVREAVWNSHDHRLEVIE